MPILSRFASYAVVAIAAAGALGYGNTAWAQNYFDNAADKDTWCKMYANQAIADIQTNIENGCGNSGPAWGNTWPGHYDWCMRQPDTIQATQETIARDDATHQCEQCGMYARDAAKDAAEFNSRGCDKDGTTPTMTYASYDYQKQLNMCLHDHGMGRWSDGLVQRFIADNDQALQQCIATHPLMVEQALKLAAAEKSKHQHALIVAHARSIDPPNRNDFSNAAPTEFGDPNDRDPGMLPSQASSGISKIVSQEATPEANRVADRVTDVIKDGAKAAVVGAVAVKAGRKIIDYGGEHVVEIRRAAETAKDKLKERISEVAVRRTIPTKLGDSGLHVKLSHFASAARGGFLRRLLRRR